MDLAFTLKKIISAAIMPLSITLFILFLGLLFLNDNNIKKAKLFIATGFISLIIIAYQPFTNLLFDPLEKEYSTLTEIPSGVTHILLLGGDVNNRGWEALRLYHKIENAKKLVENSLCLPSSSNLTNENLNKIVSQLNG